MITIPLDIFIKNLWIFHDAEIRSMDYTWNDDHRKMLQLSCIINPEEDVSLLGVPFITRNMSIIFDDVIESKLFINGLYSSFETIDSLNIKTEDTHIDAVRSLGYTGIPFYGYMLTSAGSTLEIVCEYINIFSTQ